MADLRRLPIATRPVRELASAALAAALPRDLTAYDACYLVLAQAAGATLVTADRRLAAAYDRAELLA